MTALVVAGATAVAPAGAARAADSQIQATLRLTSSIPGTPTGAVLNLVRPDGKDGKPKTEAEGIFQLPAGTVINQQAVPPCMNDDITWQVEAYAACPSSHVGDGFASLYTGVGAPVDPLGIDEQWYYAPGEIVALYSLHGHPYPVVKIGHVKIKGASFDAPLDLPPGYPPGTKTAPKATDVTLQPYVGAHGAFITTPPTCPPDGRWITTVTLHYDDGTTDEVSDATPCSRTSGSGAAASRRARAAARTGSGRTRSRTGRRAGRRSRGGGARRRAGR